MRGRDKVLKFLAIIETESESGSGKKRKQKCKEELWEFHSDQHERHDDMCKGIKSLSFLTSSL